MSDEAKKLEEAIHELTDLLAQTNEKLENGMAYQPNAELTVQTIEHRIEQLKAGMKAMENSGLKELLPNLSSLVDSLERTSSAIESLEETTQSDKTDD